MRDDGSLWSRLRGVGAELGAAPVTPLRGLALLVCTAVAATALLGLLGRPGPAAEQTGRAPAVLTDPVVVHVAGLVARPGLYRLAGGARVADALAAAGGALPGADLSALNLARVLEDGELLVVAAPGGPGGGGPSASGGAAPGTQTGAQRPDGKLDLNRATAAELDALPGIGPVLAGRIVAYREQHGGFRSVRDLRRVQGIGEKLYQSLAELVAV